MFPVLFVETEPDIWYNVGSIPGCVCSGNLDVFDKTCRHLPALFLPA